MSKYNVCACGCGAAVEAPTRVRASRPKRYRKGHHSRVGTFSLCTICGRRALARKLCSRHYERLMKYGSPTGVPQRASATARFAAKLSINPETGCWEWTGQLNRHGYGRFSVANKLTYAHRFAYVMAKGEIPDELELDHLCRNRRCANPLHLEAVTRIENMRRGDYAPGKARK